MKKFGLILLLVCQSVFADCEIRQASQLIGERNIGNIENLSKEKSHQKCQVKFDIVIDGEKHDVAWTHEDYGDPEISCQKAIKYGLDELFLRLGGKFQTEAITTCTDGNIQKREKFKKGDSALENEFGFWAERKKYFKSNGNTCRFYQEQYSGKTFKGVICQNDNGLWTVVDKF